VLSIRHYARLGAAERLKQIDDERRALVRFLGRRHAGARPGRTISAAGRRRMSAGMKRYWARRRAAEKGKG
jgi:hypothetical protein